MTVTDAAESFAEKLRTAERDDMLRMLENATETEALIAVRTLGLRELFRLPREIVEKWHGTADTPGTARFVRTERLTTERWVPADAPKNESAGRWRIQDIAEAANVAPSSVSRWRTNFNNGDPDWKKCLPTHEGAIGDVKQPGERKGQKGGFGIPLFEPSLILDWLKRSRKVTSDLYPHARSRGGGIPPGRPPRQRTGE
jgi:hypothetical protein